MTHQTIGRLQSPLINGRMKQNPKYSWSPEVLSDVQEILTATTLSFWEAGTDMSEIFSLKWIWIYLKVTTMLVWR